MLKRMSLLILFCLLASPFGIVSSAHRSQLKVDLEAIPAQDAKSSNAQGDEAGGIELAEKSRAAMGASGNEGRIKTVEQQTEVEVMGQLTKTTRISERSTGRFYQLAEGPNGNREMGFDGKRVWQKTPSFHGYLADDDPMASRIIKGENESPLLSYKKTGQKLYRLPNETIDGKEYLIVRTTTRDRADREIPIKFYLDPATYFLRRTVTGAAITQTSVFEDYRQVDGVWIAFTVTTITPQATIVMRVKSVKHNITIDPAKFEYHDDAAKPENVKPESPKEGASPPSSPVAAAGDELIPEAKRIEAFELAWKTVNDTYWDRTFNGVDWKAIHEKYLPLVKAPAKSKEFHELLNLMVHELHLSHFRVAPPEGVAGLYSSAEDLNKVGDIGAELGWLDGQLVVVDLDKDYPAYAAGIRKGFVVAKINGKTPEEIYLEEKKKAGGFELREELARVRAARLQLGGKIDVPVKLELLNEQDKPIQVDVARKARPMTGGQLEFEFEKLDNNIGYIKFNLWFGNLIEKFQTALRELRDTQALIIDLRGNPGGAGDLAKALANLLSANAGSLGSMQLRYALQPYSYKGTGDQAYKGKVILLVDEGSGSTSEVFSGGLQVNKRVTVIGTSTAGAVLPSQYQLLPTGGVLQHVISNFQTPNGVVLEGRGVLPDISARLSRKALLAGRDPARERAIEFINAQTEKPITPPTKSSPVSSSAENKSVIAPAFNLTSLDGKKLELTSLRGKVVVLNFWFMECKPCVEEMPTLNGLVDEFKDKDVVFIAPTWDNEATLRTFLREHSFKYQVVPNARDMILGSYGDGTGNMPFPMHLVIDKEGRIDMKVTGALVTKQGTKKLDDFRNTLTRLVNVPFDKAK